MNPMNPIPTMSEASGSAQPAANNIEVGGVGGGGGGARPPVEHHPDDLIELLRNKIYLQNCLGDLEHQIYNFEGCYLEDTANVGNVARGWDAYRRQISRNASSRAYQEIMEPRGPRRVNDADRIFSYSSITSPMYRNAPATAGGQGPSNANNDSETEDDDRMMRGAVEDESDEDEAGAVAPPARKKAAPRRSTGKSKDSEKAKGKEQLKMAHMVARAKASGSGRATKAKTKFSGKAKGAKDQ